MFEAVQFIEARDRGMAEEKILGEYSEEINAIDSARRARTAFMQIESADYAWWIVREKGATLATFIADNKTDKEFVLDLTSGELVEVPT